MKRVGKGWVEPLPSGRFRARAEDGSSRGTYDTRSAALLALKSGTLGAYWLTYCVRRRQLGVRDWSNDESRWELYIAGDPIAKVPFTELHRRDSKAWLARMHGRGLAPQTIKNAMNLARGACASAVEDELLTVNPFDGMRVHRSSEARTHEGWTILDPDEQLALLRVVPSEELATVEAALFCGYRNSEQWALRRVDVDLSAHEVAVRYSKGDKPVKSGKIRRVPLFGLGLEAHARALETSRGEYVFPSPRTGQRRFDSSHPSRWQDWLRAAGITRRVRWYDLRHTCATSLLAGWWGRKWSIDEVRQMLGHSSIKVTERYAHLIDDTLRRAGRETPGRPTRGENAGADCGIRTRDLRFTNSSGLEGFPLVALRDHYRRFNAAGDQLAGLMLTGVRLLLTGAPIGEVRRACALGAEILDSGEPLKELG